MKITKRQLRRIIKEEKAKLLSEMRPPFKGGYQHEEPDNSEVKPTPGGYDRGADDLNEIDSLAQAMFTAYNNIAAALDDAEELIPVAIRMQIEDNLEVLEKLSEELG